MLERTLTCATVFSMKPMRQVFRRPLIRSRQELKCELSLRNLPSRLFLGSGLSGIAREFDQAMSLRGGIPPARPVLAQVARGTRENENVEGEMDLGSDAPSVWRADLGSGATRSRQPEPLRRLRSRVPDGLSRGLERLRWLAPRLPADHSLRLRVLPGSGSAGACLGAAGFSMLLALCTPVPGAGATAPRAMDSAPLVSSQMESGPLWVGQAAWDLEERELVIADPEAGKVFVFDQSGRIVRRIAKPGQGPLEFLKPAYPFVVGDRYLIGSNFYRWVWLDREFVPIDSMLLEWEDPQASEYRQLFLYSFDAGATKFFGVGQVQSHDLKWSEPAMFAAPFGTQGRLEHLGTVAADEDELSAYHSGPSEVAACGDQAYLLRMSASVSLERFGSSRGTLKSFPKELRRRPDLPLLLGRESVAERRAAMHLASLAEALFCIEDRWLLILARQPRAGGGTRWLVFPVDPLADTMAGAIELPTRADEIVFVPGRSRWAVLEKGQMKQVGYQPLTRMTTFPRPDLGRFVGPP